MKLLLEGCVEGSKSWSGVGVLEPFGLLVPAHALTDLGAQLPSATLGRALELVEDLPHPLGGRVRQLAGPGVVLGALERAGADQRHRPPPAPVRAADLTQPGERQA